MNTTAVKQHAGHISDVGLGSIRSEGATSLPAVERLRRLASERIEAARREVKLALELENAERTRFEQGDSHLLIVNIREQQTAEAELREVDAFLDYHRATADLKAARGE